MSRSAVAGLTCLQWVSRGVQLACSAITLAIYSYFLTTLTSHRLAVPPTVQTVEAIAAAGLVYALLGVLFACCLAGGRVLTSFVALLADLALAGAFIFVAAANRDGAGSCGGPGETSSVLGTGPAGARPGGGAGGVGLVGGGGGRVPTFAAACRLETTVLAAACIAVAAFLASAVLEVRVSRARRQASRPLRDGEGQYVGKPGYGYDYPYYYNDNNGGAAQPPPPFAPVQRPGGFFGVLGGGMPPPPPPPFAAMRRPGGFFGALGGGMPPPPPFAAMQRPGGFSGGWQPPPPPPPAVMMMMMGGGDPDRLPMHQQPNQYTTRLEPVEDQWAEVQTLRGSGVWEGSGGGRRRRDSDAPPVVFTATTAPRPAASMYIEGDAHLSSDQPDHVYDLPAYREVSKGVR